MAFGKDPGFEEKARCVGSQSNKVVVLRYYAFARLALLPNHIAKNASLFVNEILFGAIDFFILDQHWADRWRMFPLRYSDFLRSYEEILLYLGSPPSRPPELEKLAMVRFRQALQRDTSDPRRGLIGDASFIHRLREREPIHRMAKSDQRMHRRHWWPEIGLATHHDPAAKQEILRQLDLRFGDHLQRLIAAKDLAYFNRKTS